MRICQECGMEVKEDESVCPRCGSEDIKTENFCRILGTKLD
ncbi:zinc-ribbon domain-containing protein [Methanobrevibacter sp.]